MRVAVAFAVVLLSVATVTTVAFEPPATANATEFASRSSVNGPSDERTTRSAGMAGAPEVTELATFETYPGAVVQYVGVLTRRSLIGTSVEDSEREPNDDPNNANSIQKGRTVRGEVSTVTDLDAFTVSVDAGTRVVVKLQSLDVGGTLQVSVYGPDLGTIESMYASGGGQNSLQFRPSRSGNYHVVVSSVRNRDPALKPGTGTYALVVNAADETDESQRSDTPTTDDGPTTSKSTPTEPTDTTTKTPTSTTQTTPATESGPPTQASNTQTSEVPNTPTSGSDSPNRETTPSNKGNSTQTTS